MVNKERERERERERGGDRDRDRERDGRGGVGGGGGTDRDKDMETLTERVRDKHIKRHLSECVYIQRALYIGYYFVWEPTVTVFTEPGLCPPVARSIWRVYDTTCWGTHLTVVLEITAMHLLATYRSFPVSASP